MALSKIFGGGLNLNPQHFHVISALLEVIRGTNVIFSYSIFLLFFHSWQSHHVKPGFRQMEHDPARIEVKLLSAPLLLER